MGLSELVSGELMSGLPNLAGARLAASVPLHRAVVGEVLPLLPGLPPGLTVSIEADQQVQVRYGSFYANAWLRPEVTLSPRPVITLELASQLVAWGLQRAPLPPFVRVSGRWVQIWLAEIPALGGAAPLWRHVEQLTITSIASGLDVTAIVRVQPPDGSAAPASPPRHHHTRKDRAMTEGRLQAWWRQQLETGLPALAGARVAGTVPLPVAMLNDLIAEAVADAAAHPPDAPVSSSQAPFAPDIGMLARMVRHVRVDASPGIVTLDFEIGVRD